MSGNRGARGAKRGVPHAINRRDKQHSRLYQLRMNKNLSQRELAERAGITRNTVMLIENGDTMPNLDTLRKLCEALNVDISTLFE